MIYIARWKIFLILVVCLVGMLFALPNVLTESQRKSLPSWLHRTVNLGLELRGGSYLQLEVDLKAVYKDQLSSLMEEARAAFRKEKLGYKNLVVNGTDGVVNFSLRDLAEQEKAKKILRKIDADLEIAFDKEGKCSLKYGVKALEKLNDKVIQQSIEVVRRRIDEAGTKEPTIQSQGDNRIIIQLPGVDDPGEVKRLLGRTAKLTFRLVDEKAPPPRFNAEGKIISHAPPGVEYLAESMKDGRDLHLPVKKKVLLSGDMLIDSQATFDENGRPAVSLKFNSIGARKFGDLTTKYTHHRFAIVLDETIIMAPTIRVPIPDGSSIITSPAFSPQETHELSLLLRAGALPAPLKVIEERTVGPSLGADSIHDGQMATTLAIVLVAIFMLLSYSLFGFFADIALILNLIFLFAALAVLQATLTLPGIAGIALTVGMAVDSNVLIFERIKEELRKGTRVLSAIEAGYSRAVTTIIDSNLTTLIGTAVLFEFGTGPIRGFAVTLALGIVISMFTAISFTRLIVVTWYKRKKPETLPI